MVHICICPVCDLKVRNHGIVNIKFILDIKFSLAVEHIEGYICQRNYDQVRKCDNSVYVRCARARVFVYVCVCQVHVTHIQKRQRRRRNYVVHVARVAF